MKTFPFPFGNGSCSTFTTGDKNGLDQEEDTFAEVPAGYSLHARRNSFVYF